MNFLGFSAAACFILLKRHARMNIELLIVQSEYIYHYCGLLFHFTAPNLQHATEIGRTLRIIGDELDGNHELDKYVCSLVKFSISFQEK